MRWVLWIVLALVACDPDPPGPMPALLHPPAEIPLSVDDQCRPGSTETLWVLEGDAIEVPVGCSLPLVLDADAFTLPELPPGASFSPSTGTLSWRPALDQAGIWHVPVTVSSLGEKGYLHVGVVENWGAPGNVRVKYPEGYAEEYGLPVVHLSRNGGMNQEYAPATLVHRGRSYDIQLKFRGHTSIAYPKKSFTVKLDKADPFVEPHFAGGFVRRKFVLTSNFDDASYVRARLSYDLWNRLDEGHVPVKTFSVVVYLQGEYWGLYTLGDHVDKHLLDPNGIAKSANIYKAVTTQSNFRSTKLDGSPKPYLWLGIDKKEGLPEQGQRDAFADLEDFIETVDQGSEEAFANWWDSNVRGDDFLNWWVLAVFGNTSDSIHKNVYFIHDPVLGPWRCVPWDFNASFGQNYATLRNPATVDEDFTRDNELFVRLLADPRFRLRERMTDALAGPLDLPGVLELVDGYFAEIDAGARRDWARWGGSYRAYFNQPNARYEEEAEYLRRWVVDRVAVLRARYP